MTFRAMQAIGECEVIVGYKTYTKLIKNLLDGKTVISSPMRDEEERCRLAFDVAREGKNTALIILGVPLMHDFAVISLSDLLTPWELIKKKGCIWQEREISSSSSTIRAAGEG